MYNSVVGTYIMEDGHTKPASYRVAGVTTPVDVFKRMRAVSLLASRIDESDS